MKSKEKSEILSLNINFNNIDTSKLSVSHLVGLYLIDKLPIESLQRLTNITDNQIKELFELILSIKR